MHIQRGLPCDGNLDITRSIVGGRIAVTPISGREQMLFDLSRLDVFLAPFSVHHQCRGIEATVEFYEIGLKLASAVRFPGEEVSGAESGQFRFIIPKEKFLIFESILDNAPVRQPETNRFRQTPDARRSAADPEGCARSSQCPKHSRPVPPSDRCQREQDVAEAPRSRCQFDRVSSPGGHVASLAMAPALPANTSLPGR